MRQAISFAEAKNTGRLQNNPDADMGLGSWRSPLVSSPGVGRLLMKPGVERGNYEENERSGDLLLAQVARKFAAWYSSLIYKNFSCIF